MADNNKDLPLVVAEILIEMQEMRRQSQQQHQELIQVFNRSFETMLDYFGGLRKDVRAIEGTVQRIDQRLEKVEKKVDEFTDFDRRLRTLEDIVLRKAS